MKKDHLLWISFQSNAFADVGHVQDDFNPAFTQMKTTLEEEEGFHLAQLGSNMRNTQEISQLKVDNEDSTWAMREGINKLSSTLSGKIPLLILLNNDDWRKPLAQEALKYAYKAMDDTNGNIVILHTDYLKTDDIHNMLNQLGIPQQIIPYPCSPSNQSQSTDKLKEFLNEQDKILICHQDLFVGCEASNIIYFVKDATLGESVRCSFLRASQNLIILCDYKSGLTFKGFNVENKFLTCYGQMEYVAYECITCLTTESMKRLQKYASMKVCKGCKYACHQGHDLGSI